MSNPWVPVREAFHLHGGVSGLQDQFLFLFFVFLERDLPSWLHVNASNSQGWDRQKLGAGKLKSAIGCQGPKYLSPEYWHTLLGS